MNDPNGSAPAIELRGLGKEYVSRKARTRAVADLSLDVAKGEIFGLLGPNGAGKTTTIRMLCGLLAPTEGEAFLQGVSMSREPTVARAMVGLVPGEAGNLEVLTAWEELAYYGAYYGLSPDTVRERAASLLDRLGLIDRAGERVGAYSKGMRRKLHLVRALLHDPKVLILDEPTSGLDPEVVEDVWEILKNLAREKGVTILFSSHQLEEVERLCDRVAIINVRLLAGGTLQDLTGQAPQYRVAIRGGAASWSTGLEGIPGISDVAADDGTLSFRVDRGQEGGAVPEAIARLVGMGAPLLSVIPAETDLRSLYRGIVNRGVEEGGEA